MTEKAKSIFGHNTRFLILAVSTICLTLNCANSLALNFTIICMEPAVGHPSIDNRTIMSTENERFTTSEKSWLFSATAIGSILGVLPISFLQSAFGFKKCIIAYGSVSAIATLLLPFAAQFGYGSLMSARIMQGFGNGISLPALSAITAAWSPLKNSGLYLCVLVAHQQLAPLLMMPLAGQMCESAFGWPVLYYVLGAATVLAVAAFYVVYEDSGRNHKKVSKKELAMIEEGKEAVIAGEKPSVPYGAMFTDVVVWAILVEYVGTALGMFVFMLYGPVYLHDALGFEVQNTGLAAALPFLLAIVMKFIAGHVSDRAACISQKARIVVASIMSQGTVCLSFVALALLPADQRMLILIFYTGVNAFDALNCVAIDKSCQLACAKYGYVVFAIVTVSYGFISLLIPIMVGLMAPEGTAEQWRRVFWLIAALVVATDIPFLLSAQEKPRPWVANSFSHTKTVPHSGLNLETVNSTC